ncbi:ricin-type beta-trefoil lectin domain protein [Streptomyces sp. NPDC006207]
MAASPDEPTAADDEAGAVRRRGPSPLPRRTRRTNAIAEADATRSQDPPDWTTHRTETLRARQAAALPVEPEDTSGGSPSGYADGFAAGLAFASYPEVPVAEGGPTPGAEPHGGAGREGTALAAPRTRGPRRLLLAGACLVAGLLLCVPFLLRGSDPGEGGSAAAPRPGSVPGTGSSSVGTVPASPLDVTRPSPGRAPGQSSAGDAESELPPSPRDPEPGEAAPGAESGEVPVSARPSSSEVAPGVAIRSHASRRCIDGGPVEGAPLRLRDCTVSAGQSWRIVPEDRSIRISGTCMDVAGGSTADGAAVRLADCSGAASQRFRLNPAHDLVNLQAHKCVEATDPYGGNGTALRLWTCTGADNQKWSSG